MADKVIRNVVLPIALVVSGLVLGGLVGLIVRNSGG
jgi:hypothetical protein